MAVVEIEGMFMASEVKTSNFNGESKTDLIIELYQKGSSHHEKMVSMKTNDLSFINVFQEQYVFGSTLKVKASVSAYQNKAYYRFLEIVE